jgi:hypothetical protein
MSRLITLTAIVILAVCGAGGAVASAHTKPRRHCTHHPKRHRCKKQIHKKPIQKSTSVTPHGAASSPPVVPSPSPPPAPPTPAANTTTELIAQFVGIGGPHGVGPVPLSGVITVLNSSHTLVAEQPTGAQGEVTVPVSPGSYTVMASWAQEPGQAPCETQEVTVAEHEQRKVTLGCVIN